MLKLNDGKLYSSKVTLLIILTWLLFPFGAAKIAYAANLSKMVKFPVKPIKLIVPAAPGGSIDSYARIISPFLEKYLGVPVIIENVVGASGAVAYNRFPNVKPDGYSLLSYNFLSSIVLELTRKNNYVSSKFTPIAGWNVSIFTLVVHPDSWKTFTEFVTASKQKEISIASTGGSADLQGRLLQDALGAKFRFIPYGSAGESISAVAGKHVDAVLTVSVPAIPMIRAGKLRVLGVFSPKPDPFLPGLPTLKELGQDYIPCLVLNGGLAAPPKTPPEIIAILEETVKKITGDPQFKSMTERVGTIVDYVPSNEINTLTSQYYGLVNKYKDAIK